MSASSFAFAFAGDDIEEDGVLAPVSHAAETGALRRPARFAFPIAGQPSIQPRGHDLKAMLESLPSKLVYSTLVIKLDDGAEVSIPRRELWDVRVQLMAEEDDEGLSNLGTDDVKTGVYEGGFKSWESSVDVVKVLRGRDAQARDIPRKFLELGCGTALPSLAVLQWHLQHSGLGDLSLGLADYNPTVLQLVTLPNLLLSWAQVSQKDSWEVEGELELGSAVIEEFLASLSSHSITLSFFSGAWGPEFVRLVGEGMDSQLAHSTVIGAETIYSPFALRSFAETLVSLLETMPDIEKTSLVAAKKVYFGVGGSMEDFCQLARCKGAVIEQIREESDGVRRAVVEVKIPAK